MGAPQGVGELRAVSELGTCFDGLASAKASRPARTWQNPTYAWSKQVTSVSSTEDQLIPACRDDSCAHDPAGAESPPFTTFRNALF